LGWTWKIISTLCDSARPPNRIALPNRHPDRPPSLVLPVYPACTSVRGFCLFWRFERLGESATQKEPASDHFRGLFFFRGICNFCFGWQNTGGLCSVVQMFCDSCTERSEFRGQSERRRQPPTPLFFEQTATFCSRNTKHSSHLTDSSLLEQQLQFLPGQVR